MVANKYCLILKDKNIGTEIKENCAIFVIKIKKPNPKQITKTHYETTK
jgi:hypothetical protein